MVADKADQNNVDEFSGRMDAVELKITEGVIVSTVTGSQQYQNDLAAAASSGGGAKLIIDTQIASTAAGRALPGFPSSGTVSRSPIGFPLPAAAVQP